MGDLDAAADHFRGVADELMRQRVIFLSASVALSTTTSARAAIRALRESTPPAIAGPAIVLIEKIIEGDTWLSA